MAKEQFDLVAADPIDDAILTEADLSGVFAPGKVDVHAHLAKVELVGNAAHHPLLG